MNEHPRRLMASVLVASLITPALLAFFSAQYLIENFFPDVTLIDLGAFYAIGLISGLATGVAWTARKAEGS